MDEHAYFRAIEDHFIGLRGAPLLLSPADFQVAQRWWREGVRLEVVYSALDEVFERRAEREPERPVQSLRYCASAVEAAWRRARELQQAGRREAPTPIDSAERLSRLAAAVPDDHPDAGRLRERLLALDGSPESVEQALAELDAEMLHAAEDALEASERQRLEAQLEESLAALGRRLPRAEVEAARRRLFERALRRARGLPLLTLFGDAD